MGLLTKLFDKGRLNPKMMVKTLQDHEDRIKALENANAPTEDTPTEETGE